MAFGLTPKYVATLPLNGLSNEQFIVFATEAAKKLDWKISAITANGFIAFTGFSWMSWSEEINVHIDNGIANLRSECNGSQLVDWGKNKRNIEDLILTINQIKKLTTEELLLQKVEAFTLALIPETDENSIQPKTAVQNRRTHFYSAFVPSEGYFVTPIIVGLNILVFALMVVRGVDFLSPTPQSLLDWGANLRASTISGQWWRLITSVFLHIGIIHLLFNMYALVYIGSLLEHHLGKTRFAAAYLLTGIAASVTSIWWHDLTVSAGASGAIFGLYGVFLAMLTTDLIEKTARRALLTSIGVFVAYNLLNGLKGGIDNAAHLGGLFSGLAIGFAYVRSLREPEDLTLKIKTVVVAALVILTCSFLVCRNLPNDFNEYQTKMQDFAIYESNAMPASVRDSTVSKDIALIEIKGTGIHYWNECLGVLKSISTLKLPEIYLQRNSRIIEYCNLRIKRCELLYKAIEENTERYNAELLRYDTQISAIITELTDKNKKK